MSNLKLVEIQIENFRKFRENFVLRLRSPAEGALDYMVLAGPNGCGKTTILEAILLSLGRDDLIVRDVGAADRAASPRVSIDPTTRLVATLEDTNDGATHTIQRTNMGFQMRNPTMLQFNQVIEWDPFGGQPVPLPCAPTLCPYR
jgi:DNA repair exonuclease SbcCD ATPase subunit